MFAFNFRPDRMREITRALAEPGFDEIDRGGARAGRALRDDDRVRGGVALPGGLPARAPGDDDLGAVVASHGVRQLHVAETEKYPHVTYFFNGGEEDPCEGERRELVPSPRDVPTYDKKPQMSAREAAGPSSRRGGRTRRRSGSSTSPMPTWSGHTGVIEAAVKAIETVDACLGEVVACVHESGGACLITADHGNADNMLEPDGSPNTAHSLNPGAADRDGPGLSLRDGGILADVAPTLLQLLGYDQPAAMTGRSLIRLSGGGRAVRFVRAGGWLGERRLGRGGRPWLPAVNAISTWRLWGPALHDSRSERAARCGASPVSLCD